MDCIFCKIIKGEIPSYKIYEDEHVYAFLDIASDYYGHTLVVPKNHSNNFMDITSEDLGFVMNAVKLIGDHYVTNCGFNGYNIFNNNGTCAEQAVMHTHVHIIPRLNTDGLKICSTRSSQGYNLEDMHKKLKF